MWTDRGRGGIVSGEGGWPLGIGVVLKPGT